MDSLSSDALSSDAELASALDALAGEVERLRRAVQKQGHAQELFQGRVEESLHRIAKTGAGDSPPESSPDPDPVPLDPHRRDPGDGATLSSAQRRALVELDQAVLRLLDLVDPAGRGLPAPPEDDPRSLREGLVLLQVRARNLGRSFGLEPVPAVGHPFDDRCHEVCAVAHLPGRPDGEVVEQVLPGYRLQGALLKPALVVVNRLPPRGEDRETTEDTP